MRAPVFILLSTIAGAAPGVALTAAPPKPADEVAQLERRRHSCVREAYAHQSVAQSQAGSHRNALDECKPLEDAFVTALMAESEAARWDRGSISSRARAWAASVAAYVMDPTTSLMGR